MPAPFMALACLQLAQLFIATLAALAITSEYSSGTIISSLQAVPVRTRLLGAKAAVPGIVGLGSSMVMPGLGALLRSAAGAITGAFVLLFGLPQMLPSFTIDWVQRVVGYLPTTAGQVLGTGAGSSPVTAA